MTKTSKNNSSPSNTGLFTYANGTDDPSNNLMPLPLPLPLSKYTVPGAKEQFQEEKVQRELLKLDLAPASSETPPPTIWVYQDWLEEGELTVLAGDPASGKTFLTCALATGITNGDGFQLSPGLTSLGDGYVIFVNREDDSQKTLVPRLKAAGANLDRIRFIKRETSFSFSSDEDLGRLEGHASQLKNNIGLIIIDPLSFAVDGDHRNDFKARKAYEGLTALARRLKCAILGIAHLTSKTDGKPPLFRVDGPQAIRQVPRAIMLLSKIAQGPTQRGGTHVLVHAKNNNGRMDGGFECCVKLVDKPDPTVHGPQLKLTFTRELLGSVEEIIKMADRRTQADRGTKTKFAVDFLRAVLEDGPKYWNDIESLAKEVDIKIGTLMLAKSRLKIITSKGEKGRSLWSLPTSVVGINIEPDDLKLDQTDSD